MKNKKTFVSIIALMCLVSLLLCGCSVKLPFGNKPSTGEEKTFTLQIVHGDGTSVEKKITTTQNYLANARRAKEKTDWEEAEKLINKSNINISPDEKSKSLSGGMLQRLILTRELESIPQLLICAEPLQGLDSATAKSFCCNRGSSRIR